MSQPRRRLARLSLNCSLRRNFQVSFEETRRFSRYFFDISRNVEVLQTTEETSASENLIVFFRSLGTSQTYEYTKRRKMPMINIAREIDSMLCGSRFRKMIYLSIKKHPY